MQRSPLAPEITPLLPPIDGVRLAVGCSQIRYGNRPDLLLMHLAGGVSVAGVFTMSQAAAAPVAWCRAALATQAAGAALIVNAGNANAFTGAAGYEAVHHIAHEVARVLSCPVQAVFTSSTGVIGEPLPHDKITALLPEMGAALREEGWHEAARAIMTTDTFMKCTTRSATINGVTVTLNGIAKGSGMIAPNMATLLAFVFTDASVSTQMLQALLEEANALSFNAITVDGDTSTNDTLLAFATGKANHAPVKALDDPALAEFRRAFHALLLDLALQVARDGEGAQKLITVRVEGANSDDDAKRVAFAIANSPLVKTAIAGQDANWGRIVAAAGRAGVAFQQSEVSVAIGGICVAAHGARVAEYDETPVNAHMQGRDIHLLVTLGSGNGAAQVYSCDLTHGYIDINGSYRS